MRSQDWVKIRNRVQAGDFGRVLKELTPEYRISGLGEDETVRIYWDQSSHDEALTGVPVLRAQGFKDLVIETRYVSPWIPADS